MIDLAIGVGGIIVVFTVAYITSIRKKKRARGNS
jgi:hypothetical protein